MYQLAHLNIVRMRAPLEDPIMQRFVDWLDPVFGLADDSEGFVWRLQTEEGLASADHTFDDESLLINMSVWESGEHLKAFVLDPNHMQVMKESSSWFLPLPKPFLVLWWIRSGQLPSADEAKKKLEFLAAHGPTAEAFTFYPAFPPPE